MVHIRSVFFCWLCCTDSLITLAGSFVTKAMPRDNSCLFHAIAYLCQPASASASASTPSAMRELIANVVAADPAHYNTAFLGSANQTYQQTILNPDTWVTPLVFLCHPFPPFSCTHI
jgi:hypothetical protein